MAQIQVNDVVQVTFAGTLNSQRVLNHYIYKVSAVPVAADMIAAFDALHTEISKAGGLKLSFLACVPGAYTMNHIWYQVIRPARFRKYAKTAGDLGAHTALGLTSNLQASITRVGELARRDSVGGIRIPIGTTAEAILNGNVTATLQTLLTAHAAQMKLNLITVAPQVTYLPMVGIPAPGVQPTPLFNTFVQPTARVMRRRTVGLGI